MPITTLSVHYFKNSIRNKTYHRNFRPTSNILDLQIMYDQIFKWDAFGKLPDVLKRGMTINRKRARRIEVGRWWRNGRGTECSRLNIKKKMYTTKGLDTELGGKK